MLHPDDWHPSLTADRILVASMRRVTELADPGFCLECGLEHDGVEPDACELTCDACAAPAVFGVGELLMEIVA